MTLGQATGGEKPLAQAMGEWVPLVQAMGGGHLLCGLRQQRWVDRALSTMQHLLHDLQAAGTNSNHVRNQSGAWPATTRDL